MDLALPLLVSTFVMTGVNLVKYVRAMDWNGIITQAAVWGMGVISTVLAAHSDLVGDFAVNGVKLAQTNGAAQVIIGVMLASVGSQANELLKAIDQTRSSTKPRLLDAVDDNKAA